MVVIFLLSRGELPRRSQILEHFGGQELVAKAAVKAFGNDGYRPSIGDLDISDSVTLRGVSGKTSIGWKAGATDRVFELLGDYTHDGLADSADYVLWANQNGSTGATEQFAADGDDDGDVDADDYNVWSGHYGNTLQLYDVAEL